MSPLAPLCGAPVLLLLQVRLAAACRALEDSLGVHAPWRPLLLLMNESQRAAGTTFIVEDAACGLALQYPAFLDRWGRGGTRRGGGATTRSAALSLDTL